MYPISRSMVLASIVITSACSKEPTPTPAASAAPSAAPAAAVTKVSVKANFEEFNGDYDATNVVALKSADGKIEIFFQRNCGKPLGCDVWDVSARKRDCPKGFLASVESKKPAVGASSIETVSLFGVPESSTAIVTENKLTITKLSDKEIEGKIDPPSTGGTGVQGSFSAHICPPE